MGSAITLSHIAAHLRKNCSVLIIFILISCALGIGCFVGSSLLKKQYMAQSQQLLITIENQVANEISKLLDDHQTAVKNLLESFEVREICGQLAGVESYQGIQQDLIKALQKKVRKQELLAAAYDVLFVTDEGNIAFSLKGTAAQTTISDEAVYKPIYDLLDDVAVLLSPSHADYAYFPQFGKALMVMGIPVLSYSTADPKKPTPFCGMFTLLIDLKKIQKSIDEHLLKLGKTGDIFIAQRKGDKGLILFNTNHNPQAALKEEFPLAADTSIARALAGKLGISQETVERQAQLELRDYIMRVGWTIAIEQHLKSVLFIPNLLHIFMLVLLSFSLLMVLLLVIVSLETIATFLQWQYAAIAFLIASALLITTIWWLFAAIKEYRINTGLVQVQQETQFKTSVQHTSSLILEELTQTEAITHNVIHDIHLSITDAAIVQHVFDAQLAKTHLHALALIRSDTSPIYAARVGYEIKHGEIKQFPWLDQLTNKPFWSGPYIQKEFGNDLVVAYAEPIYDAADAKKRHPLGYLVAALNYRFIKDKVGTLGPKLAPHAWMFKNDTGRLTYYPDKTFVEQGVLFNELYPSLNTDLKSVQEKSQQGFSGSINFKNKQDDEHYLGAYESIPEAEWTLFAYAKESDFSIFTPQLHAIAKLIAIILVLLVTLSLFLGTHMYLFNFDVLSKFCRIYPIILTFGFLSLIGLHYKETAAEPSTYIESQVAIDQVSQEIELSSGKKPIPILTGIQLQFLDIQGPNKIVFELLVWQKFYGKTDIMPGIEIANSSEKVETFEQHTVMEDGAEIKSWRMKGTVFQLHPQYRQMPFDSQRIEILIKPADKTHPVVLVPDIDAYKSLDPKQKPGIESFYLPNFSIQQSYFTYERLNGVETLDFNLMVQRNLGSVLLQYFLPLLVILISLFMMSLIPVEKLTARLSFVTAYSGLFFGLILIHQNVRAITVTTQLSFLEMIIIYLYALIVFSYVGVLVWYRSQDVPYKRVLFWPLVLTYILLVSIYSF